ncbi:MAG: ATP-binding cassette domain-containing protein [Opitutaceae bacterium]|nr:ATP-binding cassette domain-containing protein [Opitutaceae bacterium]
MAAVKLQLVEKRYLDRSGSEHLAVRGLNLEIASGEFMVLVGPSGCGKSTTLRMIAGLETISGGTITLDGRVINDVHPRDRDIAMVFQNYALYPHMSVYDNMAFGLKMRGHPKAEIDKRVGEAAEMLELTPLLSRAPKALSGGQRQRVALGRAIVRKPKVFLFDEPLSNLDAKMRVAMRAELGALHKLLGSTMIYVTHDQVEAMTLGDRICVMNGGEVQQVAAPLELYRNPANIFTAGFIGSPPMNLLRAGGRLLGFRPEDAEFIRSTGPGTFSGEVTLIEHMGSESLVHVELPEGTCIIRSAPTAVAAAGDVVHFRIRDGCERFFDPVSGLACHAGRAA